jgi:hypothetical protein
LIFNDIWNKLPQEHLQLFELTAQVLLDNAGDASVCQPVELALERIVSRQERNALFQAGSTVPDLKQFFTVHSLVLIKNINS